MVTVNEVHEYLDSVGTNHDAIQQEMAEYAERNSFPYIGLTVGRLLMLLAQSTGSTSIFEFGSGFGYSAYWFLRGMPDDGRIILTELDENELSKAHSFLERGNFQDRAVLEHGDAMEVIDRYDGPFDIVLIDHQKERYRDAYVKVRDKLDGGGLVVADNMTRGPFDLEALIRYYSSEVPLPADQPGRSIAQFLDTVSADNEFSLVLLPIGNGIAIATRKI